MKTFKFSLKHDNGTASITIRAGSIKDAKKLVMELEKCPESAITWWRIVPTAKQIKKTQIF